MDIIKSTQKNVKIIYEPKEFILDKELRRYIRKNALDNVLSDYKIEDRVKIWDKILRELR